MWIQPFSRTLSAACLFFTGGLAPLIGAEPEVTMQDLPRVAPTEASKALSTIKPRPGFELQLAASEPLVMDPVAASFDERGRLYVIEMRDYSERRDERLGRVRLLEDLNGDGVFDKSSILATNLAWPTAIICYNGGVFVAATPDILYLKDNDGDGVADEKSVVFTGFGANVEKLNVQQLVNSFSWTFDNRIHAASGGNSGVISCLKTPGVPALQLRGRDFSFDPRTFSMRAEVGGGQHGMSFDNRGRKFVCSNSSHIMEVMYEDRYTTNNAWYVPPPPNVMIAVDGGAAEVYRLSGDEPWRVLRTRWRVSGLVPGPIEGGGRPSGYFTGATGVTIYRGDAWPEDYSENAFTADCGSNLIHRKQLTQKGVILSAARAADEQKSEFIASTDNWFRPVQMLNGPDGALYVLDMYREVIEHPWSIPQSIKRHLDLNSGNNRGRIYRVVPRGFQLPRDRGLDRQNTPGLVKALNHQNAWTRETAARLLYEKNDPASISLLKNLTHDPQASGLGRTHALYTLEGLGALDEGTVRTALADKESVVRQHGIRLSENLPENFRVSNLPALAADADPLVRYQLAFTFSTVRSSGKNGALVKLVQRDASDPWARVALLLASTEKPVNLLFEVVDAAGVPKDSGIAEYATQLARIIGARNDLAEANEFVDQLSTRKQLGIKLGLLNAFAEALNRSGRSLLSLASAPRLTPLLGEARRLAGQSAAGSERMTAIQVLAHTDFTSSGNPLFRLLVPSETESIQNAALRSLVQLMDARNGQMLFSKWETFTPAVRQMAIELMLRRRDLQGTLLMAIKGGLVAASDLTPAQKDALRKTADATTQGLASNILGAQKVTARKEAIAGFLPALKLKGDPDHGKTIFQERCSTCHLLARVGHSLGPDLATVKTAGKETILGNIIDPNKEVAPRYLNYQVETRNGEVLTGIVASESATSLVLRRPNSDESSILRSNITKLKSLGQSVMPEGLEAGMTAQDMADLLELIVTSDPSP